MKNKFFQEHAGKDPQWLEKACSVVINAKEVVNNYMGTKHLMGITVVGLVQQPII